MGNDHNYTAGCIFMNSDVVMSSCKFSNFKAGAVFSVASRDNKVLFQDCEITKGAVTGMYC
jgi:hypothetical protein